MSIKIQGLESPRSFFPRDEFVLKMLVPNFFIKVIKIKLKLLELKLIKKKRRCGVMNLPTLILRYSMSHTQLILYLNHTQRV